MTNGDQDEKTSDDKKEKSKDNETKPKPTSSTDVQGSEGPDDSIKLSIAHQDSASTEKEANG